MMQNINIYVSLFVVILSFASCRQKNPEQIYYYEEASISHETTPNMFWATRITEINGIRKVIQYCYDLNEDAIVHTQIDFYRQDGGVLYKLRDVQDKVGQVYLSLADSCIEWNHSDSLYNEIVRTKHCLTGRKRIELQQTMDSIDAYVFIKETGVVEKVVSRVFYDEEFVLVEEEYMAGFSPYFHRYRTQDPPVGLVRLMR